MLRKAILGTILLVALVAVLFVTAERVEAQYLPCWANKTVFLQVACDDTGCFGKNYNYVILRFSPKGKIVDFNLFQPGGKVKQCVYKKNGELEVTIDYPGQGFTIKIHIHFECDGNECLPLVPSGLITIKYRGMGTITTCNISSYYSYGGVGVGSVGEGSTSSESSENAISFEEFINNLIASARTD